MTAATLSSPKLWAFFSRLFERKDVAQEPPHRIERQRREFIGDMLTRNPDAFASDHDVQSMMQMYPGRF